MNHNAYFVKNAVDTEFRNLETYFNLCTVSVSETKGFLEVGDAKNIIVEDYDDLIESQILLPADGIIVYKGEDFSIKLLIQGNATYKVTEQMNDLIAYFEKSPTIIKDTYRQVGNKIVLLGWQGNMIKLNNVTASANEMMLLNLKFKKVFSKDVPIVYNIESQSYLQNTTTLELEHSYKSSLITNDLFIEQGFYFKLSTDTNYTKYVTNTTFNRTITKLFTGLTSETFYNIYPFVTTKLETSVGSVGLFQTL